MGRGKGELRAKGTELGRENRVELYGLIMRNDHYIHHYDRGKERERERKEKTPSIH